MRGKTLLDHRGAIIFVVLWVAAAILGCGQRGPRSCHVTGQVSIDGTPVQVGQISFEITTEGDLSTSGPITNGTYDLWVSPGTKKVRFSAVDVSTIPASPGNDDTATISATPVQEARNLVPEHYTENPVVLEIRTGGTHDFALTSQQAK